MSERCGILAGGNWIVDQVKIIDVFPGQDALANILGEERCNGGGPFNVLKDLALMKAPFPLEAAGLIGHDEAGSWILQECAAVGIKTEGLHQTSEAPTSYTDVMTVKESGRRTFFHQRGTNALLGPEHFDFSVSNAKIFHLGYLLLLDRLDEVTASGSTVAHELLAQARNAGILTSVDVVSEDSNRFAHIVNAALPEVDYCFVNEFEAERTTGIKLRDGDTLLHENLALAAHSILDAGVRKAVFLHYPEGACAFTPEGEATYQSSLRLPEGYIRGTVGAGDAFGAGVLFALHENEPLARTLLYGVCAAAASLSDPTTSNGMKALKDCLALAETCGFPEESTRLSQGTNDF